MIVTIINESFGKITDSVKFCLESKEEIYSTSRSTQRQQREKSRVKVANCFRYGY